MLFLTHTENAKMALINKPFNKVVDGNVGLDEKVVVPYKEFVISC